MYSMCKIKNISGSTVDLNGKQFSNNEIFTIADAQRLVWSESEAVIQAILDEDFEIHDANGAISGANPQINHLKQVGINLVVPSPFADKTGYNFAGRGATFTATASTTTNLDFTVPEGTFDFSGLNIFGEYGLGHTVALKIMDDASGTYSGTPNSLLNQFGFTWNLKEDCGEKLPYSATLYTGMIIRIEMTNNDATNHAVYINYSLHKVIA